MVEKKTQKEDKKKVSAKTASAKKAPVKKLTQSSEKVEPKKPAKTTKTTKTPAKKIEKKEKKVQKKIARAFEDDQDLDELENEPRAKDLHEAEELEEELIKETTLSTYDDDFEALNFSSDPVRDYLRHVGQVALLTYDQEKDLAKRIEMGLYAAYVLAQKKKISDDDRKNYKWIVLDGKRSREHLQEANLRLVVSLAKRYANRGMRFEHLIQEGNTGLMRAVHRYDFSKTFRFSTYATWWIRQAITRAMADQGRTIRIPVHMVEFINKMHRVQKLMETELGRDPTADELAKKMKMPIDKLLEIQKFSREPSSIFATLGGDGETEVGDLLEDENQTDHYDQIARRYARDKLMRVLYTLNPTERQVIELRSGLHDEKVRTFDEIGRIMNLTRSRVQQIEAKTRAKLKHPSRSHILMESSG